MNFLAELRRRNVIRVAGLYVVSAWLLVQIASTLLPAFDVPAWVLRAIIIVLALGFLPALVFSWVFELTPEGLKRESEIDRSRSIVDHTARKLDVAVILLLLAVGAMVWFRPAQVAQVGSESTFAERSAPDQSLQEAKVDSNPKADQSSAASIAVLPFADLSQAGDQSYFSDGMSEEILNVLVKVKGLEVASRTSSFAFKGEQNLGIPAIAQQLGVRHVLEGSVRRAGGTIRITAQLIDAEVDRHLWSETFDRPLTAENVFAIQDEIAQAIVRALVAALPADALKTVGPAAKTSSFDAYDGYLRARALVRARRQLQEADRLLEDSLQKDPKFAPAWELRAALQPLVGEYTDTPLSYDELEKRGYQFAEQALSLVADSPLALAVKANLRSRALARLRAKHDVAEVIADFERSLELDPNNVDTLNWLGLAWSAVGFPERGLELFQRCVQLDPNASACSENEYDALFGLDRIDEAWARYEATLDRGAVTDVYTNFTLLALSDQKSAFMFASNQTRYLPRWRHHEALYEAHRNLGADHSALLRDIRAYAESEQIDLDNGYAVLLVLPLGAYELIPFTPVMWGESNRRYRQSPEFKHYMRESGAYDYWRAHGFPPTCQPVEPDDFRCD